MLWPLILPFKITLWSLLACAAAATVLAPRFAVKRSKAFGLSVVLGALAFIPSCIGVSAVVAPFRFGVFHYDSYDDVDDWRVYRYLPRGATDITLEKPSSGNGFRAKFSIEPAQLNAWVDEQWTLFGAQSEIQRAAVDTRRKVGQEDFAHKFSNLSKPLPGDAVEYGGPVAPNGAGFTIWYDAESGVGFERAGYW